MRRWLLTNIVASVCLLAGSPCSYAAERGFEMVSPQYKAGYGATHIEGVASDGSGVAYYSQGTFAKSPEGVSDGLDTVTYLARREGSLWSTVPLLPPATMTPDVTNAADLSPDLGLELVQGKPGSNDEHGVYDEPRDGFFLHNTTEPDEAAFWTLAGTFFEQLKPETLPEVQYRGASPDFCHILFSNSFGQLDPTDPSYETSERSDEPLNQPLYELSRGCEGESAGIRLVGVENLGKPVSPSCLVTLGGIAGVGTSKAFNAVADAGQEIFFSTCIENKVADQQVFVRLDGNRTLEVSKPLGASECTKIPCSGAGTRAPAEFVGASEDGSRVFLLSRAPLTHETADTSLNLYEITIGCKEGQPACSAEERVITDVVKASLNQNDGSGQVLGIVRVSPDGERAYFVAQGDLLNEALREQLEAEGRPTPERGADNLYMYDGVTRTLQFVARLCSGKGRSGAVEDLRCPESPESSDFELWETIASGEAQTAGTDGRYLVFSSYGQLTPDDTDLARDVYRYDAVTGQLVRVSVGERGGADDGNSPTDNASIAVSHSGGYVRFQSESDDRAISEDGSRIVFTTAEALSTKAVNGLANVYEWNEGAVSLVSGGTGETPVEDAVISALGNDVFFVTSEDLVASDIDSEPDVYDARIGATSSQPPASRQPCSSDACQGPLTNPAPVLVPGSVTQEAGDGLAPVGPKAKGVQKRSRAKVKRTCVKRRRSGRCAKVHRSGRNARRAR